MQNRYVLAMLSEWRLNVMKYGHFMTEDLPYKPLYFQPGSPGSKYSDLIGAMCAFNCPCISHFFSDRAQICR